MTETAEFRGLDTLVGILHNISPKATPYLAGEMTDVMFDIFNESQRECPVRFGVLKASGHVEEPEVTDNNIEISIGYGGPAAGYALFVHENLAAHHKPPTKAKFLEDPMRDGLNKLTARLRNRMEAAILTQYPQTPARGHQREVLREQHQAYRHGRARMKNAIAHSRGMSPAEIHAALHSGSRSMQRGRGK